jgi:light-regulated signal transduction histidine kinase (bacteriophytochrome)
MKFVVEGAGRMQGLITDLLQYSRITKKGNPFTTVDLNDVMKATLAQFAGKIKDKDATIKVAELPKVYGDPTQLSRLFQNLLDNALKFSLPESKPEIEISLQEKRSIYSA